MTSSSTSNTNSTATPLPTTHTYPPEEAQQAAPVLNAADNEDPQSECLLCLSSPREVVLLPCRHLVACKDCALNMVEFGAGGNITQISEINEGATTVNPVTPGTATTSVPSAPIPSTTNSRRKRKAKGWFCPVCRQRKCIILQNKIKIINTFAILLSLHFHVTNYNYSTTSAGKQGC